MTSATPPAGSLGSTLVALAEELVLEPEPERLPDAEPLLDPEAVSSESSEAVAEADDSSSDVGEARPVPELELSSLSCLLMRATSSSGHHHDAETVEKSRMKAKTVLISPDALILTWRLQTHGLGTLGYRASR